MPCGVNFSTGPRNARNYISLLIRAYRQGESDPFPDGERVLPVGKQEELLAAFERLEREKIGEGTHEGFHQLLHELEKTYLR